ncbi:hypothetical protein [Rubritalea halochordaticola]|uniref:hypothetical protein n=1 Tax=Rubritalea halochordaticola TaxID=714537 RepID=UPI0031FC0363
MAEADGHLDDGVPVDEDGEQEQEAIDDGGLAQRVPGSAAGAQQGNEDDGGHDEVVENMSGKTDELDICRGEGGKDAREQQQDERGGVGVDGYGVAGFFLHAGLVVREV